MVVVVVKMMLALIVKKNPCYATANGTTPAAPTPWPPALFMSATTWSRRRSLHSRTHRAYASGSFSGSGGRSQSVVAAPAVPGAAAAADALDERKAAADAGRDQGRGPRAQPGGVFGQPARRVRRRGRRARRRRGRRRRRPRRWGRRRQRGRRRRGRQRDGRGRRRRRRRRVQRAALGRVVAVSISKYMASPAARPPSANGTAQSGHGHVAQRDARATVDARSRCRRRTGPRTRWPGRRSCSSRRSAGTRARRPSRRWWRSSGWARRRRCPGCCSCSCRSTWPRSR